MIKIFLLILIAGAFFCGMNFEKIKAKLKDFFSKPNFNFMVIIAVICLLVGIVIGKGDKLRSGIAGFHFSRISSLSDDGGRNQTNKVMVLCDFESEKDLKKWKTRNATLKLSSEHVTKGKFSGKVTFYKGGESSNVLMEDYFEEHHNAGDWSGFGQLKFDLYSDSDDTERLILKIKDEDEKAWQRNIYLAPKQTTTIEIDIDELSGSLDPKKIRQFNFFRWTPDKVVTIYLDHVRLVPVGGEEASEEPTPAASATQQEASANTEKTKTGTFFFENEKSSIGLGMESSAQKVFREPEKFQGKPGNSLQISLARNEYESAQLVLYAKEAQENVSVETSDLVAKSGGQDMKIDKINITVFVVGYVKTQKPGYPVSYVGWWPDPLEKRQTFNIEKNSLQPVWIEVYAPPTTPAGEYSGDLTLKLADGQTQTVKLRVQIFDFALPKETHLKTAFDFYYGRLGRMYPQKNGEDSAAYQSRLGNLQDDYLLDMIQHRMMPIFNFEIKDVRFAKQIEPYLNAGLSAFSIGKYGGSFDNNWPKDPAQLNELIPVYRDYANILSAAHLLDRAYIYTYDEPKSGDPQVAQVAKMVHLAHPGLKNMVCLHDLVNPEKFPGWDNDIDIWCVRNVTFNEKMAQIYKAKGKELWIYASGPEPPYPTLVIDYPAMAYRIIPWMCWKYDLKGFLYWAVNYWNENPWSNPMNTKWEQNGNGLLYYPGEAGPVSSIRLEVLRDGLEDYEYLHLLSQKINEIKAKHLEEIQKDLLNRARVLLTIDRSIVSNMANYAKNPEVLYKRRMEIAQTIAAINRVLNGETNAFPAEVTERFSKPVTAVNGASFGDQGQLTFELFRGGTFVIDGNSHFAWQKSNSYRDSAIIRSTQPLPSTYKVSAVVGDIDYDLEKIDRLTKDPEYDEGPQNENGCYLLAITDVVPTGHHTNEWWHQHRKVVIDVDNNVWGSGMPHPIFMVYFDKNNTLMAFNGETQEWQSKWTKGVTYQPMSWYKVEIEKTETQYILSVSDDQGNLLQKTAVDLNQVWHADRNHPDYFVLGDPHENYYQGAMKIKAITIPTQTQ